MNLKIFLLLLIIACLIGGFINMFIDKKDSKGKAFGYGILYGAVAVIVIPIILEGGPMLLAAGFN